MGTGTHAEALLLIVGEGRDGGIAERRRAKNGQIFG